MNTFSKKKKTNILMRTMCSLSLEDVNKYLNAVDNDNISIDMAERINLYIYLDMKDSKINHNNMSDIALKLKETLSGPKFQDPKKSIHAIIHCLLASNFNKTNAKKINESFLRKIKEKQEQLSILFEEIQNLESSELKNLNTVPPKNSKKKQKEYAEIVEPFQLGTKWHKQVKQVEIQIIKLNKLIDIGYVTEKVEKVEDIKKKIKAIFDLCLDKGIFQSKINITMDDIRFIHYSKKLNTFSFDENGFYINKSREEHLETLKKEIERRSKNEPKSPGKIKPEKKKIKKVNDHQDQDPDVLNEENPDDNETTDQKNE